MKVEKTEIATKLKKLKGFVKSEKETVSGILYKDGMLIASDGEVIVKAVLECQPALDETFVIPITVVNFIDKLPQGVAEITADKSTVKIKCGKAKGTFANVSVFGGFDDETKWTAVFSDENGEVFEKIKEVIHCSSKDANGSNVTVKGVYFDTLDGEASIVACDGFRAAISHCKCRSEAKPILALAATLQKIMALHNGEPTEVLVSGNKSMFKFGDYEIITKNLSGTFMDYKKIFTSEPGKAVFDISKSVALDILNRAEACTGGTKLPVTLTVSENKIVTFSVLSATTEFNEIMEIEGVVTEPIEIAFNPRYLIDCMKAFPKEQIKMTLYGPTRFAMFSAGELQQIILPVRTRRNK